MSNFSSIPPSSRQNINKRFSIRYKLLIVFGILITVSVFVLGFLALNMAKKAVTEKIETHLIDKASDTAEVLDGRIRAFWQFLEGIARATILRNADSSFAEKARYLNKEASFNTNIIEMGIVNKNGDLYIQGASVVNVKDQTWFQKALKGKNTFSEPNTSETDGKFVSHISVPIYGNTKEVEAVLAATIDGMYLSNLTKDIVIGITGECYILDSNGFTIAYKDEEIIKNKLNSMEAAKTDDSVREMAEFEKAVIFSKIQKLYFFNYEGEAFVASFARLNTENWSVIVNAPIGEFMGTVQTLRVSMYVVGGIVLSIALIIVYLIASHMVKPIQTTVNALQGIAQG
ncbi:MAG: cache domain-containing protein, partial [Treponema sp.]